MMLYLRHDGLGGILRDVILQLRRILEGVVQDDGVPDADVLHTRRESDLCLTFRGCSALIRLLSE